VFGAMDGEARTRDDDAAASPGMGEAMLHSTGFLEERDGEGE
jgi:hypothetical protein